MCLNVPNDFLDGMAKLEPLYRGKNKREREREREREMGPTQIDGDVEYPNGLAFLWIIVCLINIINNNNARIELLHDS